MATQLSPEYHTYTCWGNNKKVYIEALNERQAKDFCMERYGWYPMATQKGVVQ